jgi:DNA-binding IclR family transcriptional regulator
MENKLTKVIDSRYFNRSVLRAMMILNQFVDQNNEASLTEISQRIGLDASTTFRLLLTLESEKFVEQNSETGKYSLGVRCFELGTLYIEKNDFQKRAKPVMQKLGNQFGEIVHLTILDGNEVVYLDKVEGTHTLGLIKSYVGCRAPTHCTGVGKVLLAALSENELKSVFQSKSLPAFTSKTITNFDELLQEISKVRQLGYAIDDQEHENGVKCIAASIYNHEKVVAAMSISGPVERMDKYLKEGAIVTSLMAAAREISMQIGGRNTPISMKNFAIIESEEVRGVF